MSKSTKINRIDFVELPAKSMADFVKTKTFYQSVFGWTYEDWGDDYADIKGTGMGSGINADPMHRPNKVLVVIYSDDLDKSYKRVLGAKGIVTKEIFSFPGGRRFHFEDPAGNELAVWSDK